uniref:Uncharacterized protein n=1 Tax=Anguilla anguilla TaxID=7936 RepID=A0A0E9QRG2_ANGAN
MSAFQLMAKRKKNIRGEKQSACKKLSFLENSC